MGVERFRLVLREHKELLRTSSFQKNVLEIGSVKFKDVLMTNEDVPYDYFVTPCFQGWRKWQKRRISYLLDRMGCARVYGTDEAGERARVCMPVFLNI
ncbi:hypothetical protein GMAR_ORF80 [Golden Marseillevirus]|uniref:hypothetical protein n=1 Tax=Golden Marseillevirus TaxID=1720526 RepID=UPI000877ADC9|nr:hypothetical protein GMAR_ORF80 [Golden Marseillevirus]ALX27455.1 hypothetical protein GMAR_ORF80 [Golden Marseillevirus]